jgi:hypothetical protein
VRLVATKKQKPLFAAFVFLLQSGRKITCRQHGFGLDLHPGQKPGFLYPSFTQIAALLFKAVNT